MGRKATKQYPNTKIVIRKTDRIPLKQFKARQLKRGGVSYKISKADKKKKKIQNAFIVQKMGGHVFVRAGRERFPVRKLMGPSPWGVFVKKDMTDDIAAITEKRLIEEVDERIRVNVLRASGIINNPKTRKRG